MMPYVETTLDARTKHDDGILAELIGELQSPKPTGQPVIEVRNMSRGGYRHVYVIWDRWEECRPEVRSGIVRDAFATVKGKEYEKSIVITVAATVPEAVDLGLLPFEVKPLKWMGLSDKRLEPIRKALLAEGASAVDLKRYELPVLRFRTEGEAETALGRLKAAVPSLDWGIVKHSENPA
jgi:hypothetical protein